MWSTDLRAVLSNPPVGVVVSGRGHEYQHLPKTSLWFTDNDTVVATFVVQEGGAAKDGPRLSRRDALDQSSPLHLRTVFLDATSGKIKTTPDWPTKSRFASIVAAEGGKFVTQSANDLTLYAADLSQLRKAQLPSVDEPGWRAQPSPSGRNILFIASDLRIRSAVRWIWVETDSLQVVKSWEEVQSGWVGISDDQIAMTRCVWFYDCEPNVEVKGLNTEWKTVASADRHNMPHPQFVGDDLMVLLGRKIEILRPNGEVVKNEDTPFEGCWWGGVYPAAHRQRFVTPSCKATGRQFLDIGGREELKRILVYDAPFQGQPYVLDLEGSNVKGVSLIALSPDGSKLAALNGESVCLFQLPPTSPIPTPQPSKADGASHRE